jgi:protein O-mannosyl-transferase
MTDPGHKEGRLGWVALQVLLILLGVAWIYRPALHGSWIWDDLAEIANNPALRDPAGLRTIWFSPAGADYFPLKDTLLWFEWRLWGANPFAYHIVGALLHAANACLVWRLLRRLGVGCAWWGGALFAVHPLAVESVAWVSEFKNTLSLLLLLLSALAYLRWAASWQKDEGGDLKPESKPPRSYGLISGFRSQVSSFSLLFFSAAMLSKATVVMFPVVILLHAWWKQGRVSKRDVVASIPFFGVSAALGLVTVWFQLHRALAGTGIPDVGPLGRVAGAGLAATFYLFKAVLPVGLMPNYPRWPLSPPTVLQFLPWALLVLMGLSAIRSGRRSDPAFRGLVFGAAFILLNLLPVLGFVPMSYLRISWVADHFAYIALVGVAGLAAAALAKVESTAVSRVLVRMAAAALLGFFAARGHAYARIFADDSTFWAYAVAANNDSWTAHNDLGMDLAAAGRNAEAMAHYDRAIALRPGFASARVNRGNLLVRSGRLDEAVAEFQAALRAEPSNGEALADAGNALAQAGRTGEALACYETLVREKPSAPEARYGLAFVLERAGRDTDALREYGEAIRLRPDYAEARYRLGNLLGNAGRIPEAILQYEAAVRAQPGFAEAHAGLGLALVSSGRASEAVAELERAIALKPGSAEAHAYLGLALAGSGRLAEAIAQYEKALETAPSNPDIHYNLAMALRQEGREAEAAAHFAEAARLGAGR